MFPLTGFSAAGFKFASKAGAEVSFGEEEFWFADWLINLWGIINGAGRLSLLNSICLLWGLLGNICGFAAIGGGIILVFWTLSLWVTFGRFIVSEIDLLLWLLLLTKLCNGNSPILVVKKESVLVEFLLVKFWYFVPRGVSCASDRDMGVLATQLYSVIPEEWISIYVLKLVL